jgi:hypothetical protein
LQGSELYWLLFPAGQYDNALIGSVKNARLILVKLIPAGKHLKRGHFVRILIAGNVKFTVLLKTTRILKHSLSHFYHETYPVLIDRFLKEAPG